MGQKGITKFFSDFKIDLKDPLVLVFSFLAKATKMGRYEEQEFKHGVNCLGANKMDDLIVKKKFMQETW